MSELSALKVGCGKFFYGKNVLSQLPGEILRLGGKALIVGGEHALSSLDVYKRQIQYSSHCIRTIKSVYVSFSCDFFYLYSPGIIPRTNKNILFYAQATCKKTKALRSKIISIQGIRQLSDHKL